MKASEILDKVTERTGDRGITTYVTRCCLGMVADPENGEELPGVCPVCERPGNIQKRRRNTAYYEDEQNWLISCEACFENDTDYYNELWDMVIC